MSVNLSWIEIEFCKAKEHVFLSHLDLLRAFTRAFRRVNMPLEYSQGFNPHPKLSFQRALKLGVKSKTEILSVRLNQYVDLNIKRKELNECLPKGIQISKITYKKSKKATKDNFN